MYKSILPLIAVCVIFIACGNDKEPVDQQQLIGSSFELPTVGPRPMQVNREEVADRHEQIYELTGLLTNTGMPSMIDHNTGIIDFPGHSSTPGSGFVEDTASGKLYHVKMFMGHPSKGDRYVMITARSNDSLIVTRYAFEQAVTFPTGEITQTIIADDQASFTTNKTKVLTAFDEGLSSLIRLARDYKYKIRKT